MQLRSFLHQAAGVGAVSLLDRAVAVGLGIVFARWLGPAEFGAYAFVITAVGLLLLPARLGLPELLTRDIAAARGSGVPVAIRATIWKGYTLVGTAALAIVAIGQIALQFLPPSNLSQLMTIGLWLIVPTALFEVTIGILRGLGRTFSFQFYGTLLLSVVTLAIGAAVMSLLSRYDAHIAVDARFLAILTLLAVAGAHLWSIVRQHPAEDAAEARGATELMRSGLGFMVNALVYMALMRIDLLVLGVVASEAYVGLYRVAVEGGQLVAFSYAAATIVLAPEYARLHAAGEQGRLRLLVRQTSRVIMFVGVFAAIPLTAFSKEIVVLVFGPEYAGAAVALSILAVGNFITFFFGDPVFLLNMTGHHNRITVLVGISLVISVCLSLVLIPYYGIVGAAIASSTTLICYRALAFREVYKRLEINCAVLGRHPEQQRDKAS
jgi:O-antigen/teichoic acid export membrane protein